MSTPHPAAAPYAVLRVDRRKAKGMAAIAASSAHTMREKPTPNADPDGAAPVVVYLADGKTPYQAARHLLDGAERRNRDTVLCREIVLSASPSYFRPGREHIGGAYEPDKVKAWAVASLAWAKRQWPDQLASFVIHADEQNIHAHLLVVPRVKSAAGVWKLNSKALFDRERLRELQTGYGEALAPLGIRRGEPGSKAKHSEVAQFYGAVLGSKKQPERVALPAPPKAPKPPESVGQRLVEGLASTFGIETEYQRQAKAHAAMLTHWREESRRVRQSNDQAWQTMQASAAVRPIFEKQNRRSGPVPTGVHTSPMLQPPRVQRMC